MVGGQSSVTFRQRNLTNEIAGEVFDRLRGSQRCKGFTRVNLTARRDRFHSRSPADVSASVSALAGDRVRKFVSWSRMKRDAQTQVGWQAFRLPIRTRRQISQGERELSGRINVGKDIIQRVTPGVLG